MKNTVVFERKSITLNLDNFYKANIKQTIRKVYTNKYKEKEKGSLNIHINVFVPEPKYYNEPIKYYDSIRPNDKVSTLLIAKCTVEALTGIAFYHAEQVINLSVDKEYGEPVVEVVIERLV